MIIYKKESYKLLFFLLWIIAFILFFSSYRHFDQSLHRLRYMLTIYIPLFIIASVGISNTLKYIAAKFNIKEAILIIITLIFVILSFLLNLSLITDIPDEEPRIDHGFYLMSDNKIDDQCVFLTSSPYVFDFIGQNFGATPSSIGEINKIIEESNNCTYFLYDTWCIIWTEEERNKVKQIYNETVFKSEKMCNEIKEHFNLTAVFKIQNHKFNTTLYKID